MTASSSLAFSIAILNSSNDRDVVESVSAPLKWSYSLPKSESG